MTARISRPAFDGGMSRLSIPARLVLLCSLLILILVGVSSFLSRELNQSSEALAAEAHYSEILRSASAAETAFGDLKYWLTDLAVSLLNLSEENANEAKRSLQAQLAVLELYDKPAVDTIRREVDALASRALEAVDAYTADRRVIGNSLMAQARVHVAAVDETLTKLVDRLRDEAAKASEAAQLDSKRAVRTSGFVVLIASLFAVALTVFVLRSIMLPLRQIGGAITALTAGRTDIDVPDLGRHEMGAIARTLSLFRDGLIERNRLAAEREEAIARLEVARDEATKSSRLLQATFDHMSQGVCMFDRNHELVAWNSQFRDLLELPDDILQRGTRYVDFVRFLIERGDFGEHADVEEEIRRRVSGIEKPFVGDRTTLDGRFLEIRRNPVATGGFVTMYTDITHRKQAEIEIERVGRRLTDAIESISDGFALWDRDNRLVTHNDRCKLLLGAPDLFVDKLPFEKLLHAIGANRVSHSAGGEDLDTWVAAQLELHRHPPVEQEIELSGGTWLRAAARRTDEGGNVTTWTDITALKQRELELADLVERLEVARDQANEANRTKSAFLANMSHELRTPLNAIIGYSEILKEEATDQGLPEFLPDLDRIESAGRHLLGVINDVLDLSKIEAGRMDVYIEEFDIGKLVREVEAIIQPLAAKNSNKLEVICPSDLGTMRSDLTKVKQSLLNLLSNSSKFTSKGSLTLEVSRRNEGPDSSIGFRVTDTGIGMTPEQMAKLFQAFTQADTTTTKRFGGTGLGLAITKHFCDMLGGRVEVKSQLGEGSTFTMTLPDRSARASPPEGELGVPRGAEAPEGAPAVLVVDDDLAVHDLLSIALGKEGYRVIHARGGEEAMRLARESRPDAITLDVVMPHMDGWSVLSALKAQSDLSDIPVIVVTMLKDRGMALTLGATDFMTKPVDRASLLAILKRHCPTPGSAPVLLVDDDPAVRDSARRVIEKLGYTAAEAPHGKAALAWLDGNPPPALILLDLMMPIMDGFAFLDAMRDHPSASRVPVVILTSKELSADEKRDLSGRAEEVLMKESTSPIDLAEAVRRIVRRQAKAVGDQADPRQMPGS